MAGSKQTLPADASHYPQMLVLADLEHGEAAEGSHISYNYVNSKVVQTLNPYISMRLFHPGDETNKSSGPPVDP